MHADYLLIDFDLSPIVSFFVLIYIYRGYVKQRLNSAESFWLPRSMYARDFYVVTSIY